MSNKITHKNKARFWWAVGILGLIDYVWWPKLGIANSIPVLYFISVAANAIGESSAKEASDSEGD